MLFDQKEMMEYSRLFLLRSGLIFDHLKLRELFLEITFRDFLVLSICLTLYDLNWYSMNGTFIFISVSLVCIFLG